MHQSDLAKLHKPVLLKEVLEAFGDGDIALLKGQRIIDATLGIGGHTQKLLEHGADVLGIDTDKEMLRLAQERLILAYPTSENKFRGSYKLVYGNFRQIDELAAKEYFINVDGILFDLGVSSPQLTSAKRGFSFQEDSVELDMRLNSDLAIKGMDLLNALRYDQLVLMFSQVLGAGTSRKLSEEVIKTRTIKKIQTVGDFNKLISRVIPAKKNINRSTLPFLALRIAVNSELDNLKEALPKALGLLKNEGKMVIISFHSGEDYIVKSQLRNFETEGNGKILTAKPIEPQSEEINSNPRSRSAKMRIFVKYATNKLEQST